ncbi:hypothetical protein COW36_11350 [bacterium (Candidatus Blackallbacteria) CG17_big_fil_post_rev_8_21_14_2_50_48_46]|uniref:Uncharacterized protein n=1 Tax=bacterium (Candidatus Blackallbacteria) CG17_big_fil_post_rev_8_21_14_2_50_48_46 TaxID=2014261 RepID=A0A2M7G4R1_9BACT|nr:MAG: hypothetical protein COW64_18445 [bacterium (Candidatus Blackallbacteria) CG18_big_fil_WC_8_21_14_2_50_49_26]PIW16870.1 MAG: hypothetical protein COW36_11350 [bacterium (Candidatus Blackallbacteria) CG17_big_fil_post_rev_8_21_14_2_50_48_46]PIW48067.1 MAG: hypothetical protein COW20_11065 [bacterium (Candidatus Blackallbacteria) CG13_big_fil_rev_8_21_14_2_50_49_14]
MSQLKHLEVLASLFTVFTLLNACTPVVSINTTKSPSSIPMIRSTNSNLWESADSIKLSPTPEPSSSPSASVLNEQNVAEVPTSMKFDKRAQFFETSDPLMPFVLFFDSSVIQSQIYSVSGDTLVEKFQEKLNKNPGNPEVIFDLSSAYLLAGKPERTIELIKAFTNSSTPAIHALFNQCLALLKLEKFNEIEAVVKQLNDFSKQPEAYMQSEALYILLTEIELRTYPLNAYGIDSNFLNKLYDYLEKAKDDKLFGLLLYSKFARYEITLFSRSNEMQLSQALNINPNSVLFKSAFARELLFLRRYDAAQKLLDEAIESDPHSADVLLSQAIKYWAMSNPETDIVKAFEKVISLAPKWHLPVVLLSDFYAEKKKYNESANTLIKFLKATQYSMNAVYYKLAGSLLQVARFQEAIEYYNAFKPSIFIEEINLRTNRAYAYGALKTPEGRGHAIEDYTYIIEKTAKLVPTVTPDFSELDYWKALDSRSIMYFEDNQFQKSYEDILTLHKLDPKNNDIKYNLTGVLGAMGRYEESIKVGLEIPDTYSKIKLVYNNISMAYAFLKKCEESEKYARMAGVTPKTCQL